VNDTLPNLIGDYSKFIGIPYEKKNCWDLVVSFYQEMLSIPLYSYYQGPTPPEKIETKNLIYSSMGDFEKISDPKFGDIIIVKLYGIESHIAVYLGDGKMLHTTRGAGSIIDRVARWEKMIVGFYRIKK